jgi:hypothetical protein
VVYDLDGYTRFRAVVGFDDRCLQNDIGPKVRFFVFKETPDPERMVRVSPEMPARPLVAASMNADGLVTKIFEFMLGRAPSVAERGLGVQMVAVDGQVKPAGLADLLWAIAMQAEFQLIY